jgi:hypothetical protein
MTGASTMKKQPLQRPHGADLQDDKDLQGEGNYDATHRYDRSAREFVESGKVDEAARASHPRSPEEAEEMERAERAGRSHSKGEDPALDPKRSSADK